MLVRHLRRAREEFEVMFWRCRSFCEINTFRSQPRTSATQRFHLRLPYQKSQNLSLCLAVKRFPSNDAYCSIAGDLLTVRADAYRRLY